MNKFAVLTCTLLAVHFAFAQDNSQCDPNILVNLERCCDMPKLLPLEYVQTCLSNIKGMGNDTTNCLIECILKNQSMLTNSGALIEKVISKEFVTPVMNTWQPVVASAVKTCVSDVVKAFPNYKTPAGRCNARPALFMSCVGRRLALDCPTSSKISNPECKEKLSHLESCNPFV